MLDAKEKHMKANINYLKLGINIFELSQKVGEIYEKLLTIEEKRELLNFVVSNFRLRDKKIAPVFHNGFQVIAERAKDGNWQGQRESNPQLRFWRPLVYR